MPDINAIRKDFPILAREVYGKPLVYFDNAATTQKPQCVIDAIVEGYTQHNANVHRGVHRLSQEATDGHEQARRRVQQFLNAAHAHEIVFTRGTTESINLVAHSFGMTFLHDGDEVIISEMEHHANIVPWQLLKTYRNITLRIAPIDDRGVLDTDACRSLFNERTKLLAITHVSNVLGTINPVKELIGFAHAHHVPVLIDGAQSAPHLPIDVQALDADFFVLSAHKMYGPAGIGVLYGKERLLDAMPPYQGGGEMIGHVSFEKTTFNELPFKFEAGTPDYIGSAAFARALDYIDRIGIENIAAHENDLLHYATQRLTDEIDGLRIFGTAPEKSGVISFLVRNIHPYDMGMLLDKLGFALRSGHHCAQPLMQRLGVDGVLRASFALYNTREEVDAFVAAVQRVAAMF